MKRKAYQILTFISMALLITLSACHDEEKDPQAPIITLSEGFENIEGFNVGDEIRIGVNVKSPIGVKRLAYYFITATDNGTQSGTPVYIDKTDLPTEINEEIVFTVQPGLVELVIISFDRDHNNSEIHITPENIRTVPVLSFKDGIKSRESVFENKVLTVEGTIVSEYDLASVTYQTVVNGVTSESTEVAFTDKRNTPFAVSVVVPNDLTAIIIKATNIHGGSKSDIFSIGTVVEDDVNITLEGGKTSIPMVYADVNNTLSGNVFSGSAMVNLTYAIKSNGVYGSEIPMTIGTPKDEFPFTIEFTADKNIEAVRITGENQGSKTKVAEFAVEKVYRKLVHFAEIKLTSEVGPGLNNWFAAYQAPHVFDVANAAANQLMVDFALTKFTSTQGVVSYRIMPAAVFEAGSDYKASMAPYMQGFSKAPYTLVTVNRNAITPEAFNNLEWDVQLREFLDAKVRAPIAQGGENYNFYGTNRRFNADLQAGKGFIIGWGQYSPIQNQAFGIVMVKEYAVVNGVATATLEIKVPAEDMRTKYNPVSIFDYAP